MLSTFVSLLSTSNALFGRSAFACLVVCSLIFRLRLASALGNHPTWLRSGESAHGLVPYFVKFLLNDLLLAGAFSVASVGVLALSRPLFANLGRRFDNRLSARGLSRSVAWVLLITSAILVSVIYQAQISSFQTFRSGISYELAQEVWSVGLGGVAGLTSGVTAADIGFTFSAVFVAAAFLSIPLNLIRWRDRAVAMGTLVLLLLNLVYGLFDIPHPTVREDLRQNPLLLLASKSVKPRPKFLLSEALADDAKRTRLNPAHSSRRDSRQRSPAASPATTAQSLPARRLNVVLVVMESAGLRYVFDRDQGAKPPMPFLEQLAAKGWQLKNHYSTANTSPRSIFSLLTGLYPAPQPAIYSMTKGLSFPTLFEFLPKDYESFWVSPGELKWYFPRDFLMRHGPKTILDFDNLGIRRRAPRMKAVNHEVNTVSVFLRQIDQAHQKRRSFLGIYYSFVAHWPYPDYGPEFHRFPNNSKRYAEMNGSERYNRYRNNLYLLDTQIRRIVDHLRSHRLLDETLLVFVGDHGEAFGQHESNWVHSRKSFEENYQTPAIFFNPRLFSPKIVAYNTSHVDILPTLLQALGRPYEPELFQGESLLRGPPRRKQLFLYGNENTLSAVNDDRIKIQIALRKGTCWAYHLASDPFEKKPVGCESHRQQVQDLLYYSKFQGQFLRQYNRACARRQTYMGKKHPMTVNHRRP